MVVQDEKIQKVRYKCTDDVRIMACMMYGSFTKGEGDAYSDIEFYIFLKDDAVTHFESELWIADIHPTELVFFNEFGTEVAVFSNLIRGEFHFLSVSEMSVIESFKPTGVFPDTEAMHLYDETGRLKGLLDVLGGSGPDRLTDENVNFALNNVVNTWLMGVNVMRRGEYARALETLAYVQKYLLQLIRIKEHMTERWLNSTKNLEHDISEASYLSFKAVTSKLNEADLNTAYLHALHTLSGLRDALDDSYDITLNAATISKLFDYYKAY